MKVPKTHMTDRSGVANVAKIFTEDFGWLFREQPVSDLGIDTHVEIVRDGRATGKLIGLQIKSGESYVSKSDEEAIHLSIPNQNIDYWLNQLLQACSEAERLGKSISIVWRIHQRRWVREDRIQFVRDGREGHS